MRKTIVYILSTDYAGSHYLSLMLGSHSRVRQLGEVKRLKKPFRRQGMICFSCRDKGGCPVLGGIGPANVDELYDIVFSRLDPQVEVLIDNSKLIAGWTDRFIRNDRYRFKIIHLIRDPRALVRRWRLETAGVKRSLRQIRRFCKIAWTQPELIGPTLVGGRTAVLLYTWLVQNQRIEQFIRRQRVESCRLTYHDLAKDTARELRRVMEWIGLAYEPTQPEYWNFEHHGTQKESYEWILKAKTPHFDARWKTELSPEILRRVVDDPFVNAYLDHLGLAFAEDGLTTKEEPTHVTSEQLSPSA